MADGLSGFFLHTCFSDNIIKCLRRMPVLDTFLVNSLLLRANVLDKKRYTLAGLANELLFSPKRQHTGVVPEGTRLS